VARNNFSIHRVNLTAALLITAVMLLSCSLLNTLNKEGPTQAPLPLAATTFPEMTATALPVQPTFTSLPVPSATRKPTKIPTSTSGSDGGQVEVLDYLYTQNFSSPPDEWDLDPYESESVKVTYRVSDGALYWDVRAIKGTELTNLPSPRIPLPEGDFLLTASTRVYSDDESIASGLVFRVQDFDNYYFARLSNGGVVTAYALENDKWEKLAGPVMSEHFLPGKVNRLIVVQQNGRYEVQVNDYPAVTFFDFRFRKGSIGLAVELDAGMKSEISFDDLRLMQPGNSAATGEDETTPVPTIMSMGASWMTFEGDFNGIKYSIDHPFVFIHSSSGGWQQLCLDAPEKLCVSAQPQTGNWKNAKEFSDDVLSGFSSTVGDYQEISRRDVITADGLAAIEVHYTCTWQGESLEGVRRFAVNKSTGFDIAAEGDPVMMSVYQAIIKNMLDSFRLANN